ncbi:helix-turn-helix transcriptional regulator [Kineococcus glutinatus]|uniref:HTH cro/C1-type domain-containing protein n=1 Tax=Kineococcus glutinatus TaxID=1070872 RepID=A0ABP9HF02_9ACTN
MNNADLPPFALLLRQARIEARLAAREVARRAGVDVGTVTRIELGRVPHPRPAVLTAIGEVLGVSASDLFAAADWLPPAELPTLRPYLRAKYGDLPDAAVAEVEALVQRYSQQFGRGPVNGEDER